MLADKLSPASMSDFLSLPPQLGMEDEDVIEVYQEQTGGLWND